MLLSELRKIIDRVPSGDDPPVRIRLKDSIGNLIITDITAVKEETPYELERAGQRTLYFDADAQN